MTANQRVQITVALIGLAGAVIVALIALVPSLMTPGPPADPTVSVATQPEPQKLVAIPIVGTGVEFQIFRENFESTQKGWDFDKNNYLKGGRLNIDYDSANGEVHSFFNDYYQVGRGAFSMGANLKYESGPEWSYGMVLRAVGSQTFLFFSIRRPGQFRISKYSDGRWEDLTKWQDLPEGAGDRSRFGISNIFLTPLPDHEDLMSELPDAAGDSKVKLDRLYFYVDRQKIAEVANYLQGNGLQFGVFSTLNIHASFDELEVYDNSNSTDQNLIGSCTEFAGEESCPQKGR